MTDERRAEALRDLYFEAGAGLMDSQAFEFGLALLLHHLARLRANAVDRELTRAILEGDAKRTAGQLVQMLAKVATISPGLEEGLAKGLQARNRLIHRFLLDNAERIADATLRPAVVSELRHLRAEVQRADKLVRPFVEGLSGALEGADAETLRAQALRQFYGSARQVRCRQAPVRAPLRHRRTTR